MSRAYNVIDADGHILEPFELWGQYTDPKYRDRAPRLDLRAGEQFTPEFRSTGSIPTESHRVHGCATVDQPTLAVRVL
jgi:hypothetical protein